MALIKCFNCGCFFSDKAKSCPQCGAPNTNSPKKSRKGVIIILCTLLFLLLAGLVFMIIKKCQDDRNAKQKLAEITAMQEKLDREKNEMEAKRKKIEEEKKKEEERKKEEEMRKEEEKRKTFDIEVKGIKFTMIFVIGGTFTMGATNEQGTDAFDNEKPAHRITLSSYHIGQTEVSQELWQAVMGNNPSEFRGNKRPVERVSWEDCQTFIHKLNDLTNRNFRFPTEAEWEFAARGGKKSCGYKYSGSNDLGKVAWYLDNSNSTTHDIATKAPNELGIYDMSGNVLEWCYDWENDYSNSHQTNPKGPSSGTYHVARGGWWDAFHAYSRVSFRYGGNPGYRSNGLRIAL